MLNSQYSNKRILIADDEKVIRQFYIAALESLKKITKKPEIAALEETLFGGSSKEVANEQPDNEYDLTLCTNSTEAVDCVIKSIEEGNPYALVFLDVRMPPGPDGVWAAEQIRKIDSNIEIVIATAFSDIHPRQITKKVPPAHKLLYLQKPFHATEISHFASSLTAKWAMEKELQKMHAGLEIRYVEKSNELAEAKETLERMQRLDALGMVAGGIAHDFNNILSCISGHTEIALISSSKEKKLLERMQSINQACLKARDLVNRVLTFSKQNKPEMIPVHTVNEINEALSILKGSMANNITLETRFSEKAKLILADPTQINQVVMNLCTNAFHAMKANGGVLTISVSNVDVDNDLIRQHPQLKTGAYIKLTISDSGHGMDEETIKKIFDPYFTTKKKEEGTGLGLSITHSIIQKQGGAISVTSKPFSGTTFDIYLKCLK